MQRHSYNGTLIGTFFHKPQSRVLFLYSLEWPSKTFKDTKHHAASLQQLSFLF